MTKPKDVHIHELQTGFLYRLTPLRAKRWLGLWPQRPAGTPEALLELGKCVLRGYAGEWFAVDDKHFEHALKLEHDTPGYNAVADAITIKGRGWVSSLELANLVKTALDALERLNDMRHYKALVAEARRQKMPTSYETDLTRHDKWVCERRDPRDSFGWVLRRSGTSVVLPASGTWASARACVNSFSGLGRHLFYVWDGRVLMPKTPKEFEAWFNDELRPPREREEDEVHD